MNQFQYQLLRYRPDQIAGEFVNVGLVLFSASEDFLMARSVPSTARAKTLFPELKGKELQQRLKSFARQINQAHQRRTMELKLDAATSITQLTYAALPQDDSALYWSEVEIGRDVDLSDAFTDLFDRLVNYHVKQSSSRSTDAAVWTEAYKAHFERSEIKALLEPHSVKTEGSNTLEFDHAVKNGVWHLMEPVAFDLKSESRIKDKVYKWVGKLAELEKSDEEFKLYLLTRMPESDAIRGFVRDRLEQELSKDQEVKVVIPSQAGALVRDLVQAVREG